MNIYRAEYITGEAHVLAQKGQTTRVFSGLDVLEHWAEQLACALASAGAFGGVFGVFVVPCHNVVYNLSTSRRTRQFRNRNLPCCSDKLGQLSKKALGRACGVSVKGAYLESRVRRQV